MKKRFALLPALLLCPALASAQSAAPPAQANGETASFRTLSAANTNGVISACLQPGSTADAQLTHALAQIPSGGIVDARCYGHSSRTIAATVHIGGNTAQDIEQTVLFDPGTSFVPASASLDMFELVGSGRIQGLDAVLPPKMNYSGSVILIDKQAGYIHNALRHIKCDASNEPHAGYLHGACVTLQGSRGQPITFESIADVRCLGLAACIALSSSQGGYVNGNNIQDVVALSSGAVLQFNNLDSDGTTQIMGNLFSNIQGQANPRYGNAGLVFLGTPATRQNLILGLKLWDSHSAIANSAAASGNVIIGSIDHGIGNDDRHNIYLDVSNVDGGWMFAGPQWSIRDRGSAAFADLQIGRSILPGAGLQHARAGLTQGCAPATLCSVKVPWSVAFADTRYTVTCTVETPASGVNYNLSTWVAGKTTTGVTAEVEVNGSTALPPSTVNCIAMHD